MSKSIEKRKSKQGMQRKVSQERVKAETKIEKHGQNNVVKLIPTFKSYLRNEMFKDVDRIDTRVPKVAKENIYKYIRENAIPDILDSFSDFITWIGLALEDPKLRQVITFVIRSTIRKVLEQVLLKSLPVNQQVLSMLETPTQTPSTTQTRSISIDEIKKQYDEVIEELLREAGSPYG